MYNQLEVQRTKNIVRTCHQIDLQRVACDSSTGEVKEFNLSILEELFEELSYLEDSTQS